VRKNFLTESLVDKFRDSVNRKDFIFFKYKDVNGYSHWHAICSCMDWITVAVRSINSLGALPKSMDLKVVYIYSLISYIDIINESITTLYTVLLRKKRESPFKHDQSVFFGEEGKDDNDYFSELRARFGAHPVNLQDRNSKERHFASWPYDSWDDCDLQVSLYSNLVGGKDKIIKLKVEDLFKFSKLRYEYLKVLMKEIEQQYCQFIFEKKLVKIDKNKCDIKQIEILLEENKKRLDFDYVEFALIEIRDLMSVSILGDFFSERQKKFKNDLKTLLINIYEYLQNCKFDEEIPFYDILSPQNLYKIDSYSVGKIMSCLLSEGKKDSLIGFYFRRLNEIDCWGYDFREDDDRKLTLLKIHLMNRESFPNLKTCRIPLSDIDA